MTTSARRLQQRFDFFATEDQRQFSCTPRERDAFDGDFPAERVGVEKAQSADHLNIGRKRNLFLFHQEQLVLANVFGAELVWRFAEVPGELVDAMQVNPDGSGRIVADLEIFQHPLSKWGHGEAPFACDHTTKRQSPEPWSSLDPGVGPPEA